MNDTLTSNPFQITTPEDLRAEETVSLFVNVFTDLQKIIDPGHVFLIGPRGTGKSMMFRYLQPDCQCVAKNCGLADLPFLGVYVPLKDTNFSLAELGRLEQRHASEILNEHILATHFAVKIFKTLAKPELYDDKNGDFTEIKNFYNKTFLPTIGYRGTNAQEFQLDEDCTATDVFLKMAMISESLYNQAFDFAKRLAFRSDLIPYDGPLHDYSGFLLPVLSALASLSGFPSGPIYLLVDDAHWLTRTQTTVLNSWVATRTSRRISFKVSTQYNYKTYYTLSGATIDSPHDFSAIDIATIYTGSKSKYRNRVADIVGKRLDICGIKGISSKQFFPEDEEQEGAIRQIEEEYKLKHDRGDGRGYYRSDDALRYARPDFIKSLAGQKKASSKYSYAGFDQLVHLSSGIVRSFIELAHRMYAEMMSRKPISKITEIPPSIQDEVARAYANEFLFSELERLEKGGHKEAPPKEDIKKLSNLIQGLGGLFRQILLSDRSERRIFSIAFSDEPSEEVSCILDLGIQLGYFHKSTIGRKDSKSGGRTRLYVLNRCLSPIWTLDPTGFAGYLFVQSSLIEQAMYQPASTLRRLGRDGIPEDAKTIQLELF